MEIEYDRDNDIALTENIRENETTCFLSVATDGVRTHFETEQRCMLGNLYMYYTLVRRTNGSVRNVPNRTPTPIRMIPFILLRVFVCVCVFFPRSCVAAWFYTHSHV